MDLSLRAAAGLCLAAQLLLAHNPHDPFAAVTISPNFAQDQTAFAATGTLVFAFGANVLFKTTDGGVTWAPVPNLQNNQLVRQIVCSPAFAADQTLFVAGTGGLFKSTDAGSTWTHTSATPLRAIALSPNFSADQTLFEVTATKAILRSTDGGKTFTTISQPNVPAPLDVLAISPNFPIDHTLLLGGGAAEGILKSTDGGVTWVSLTVGTIAKPVEALVFSPAYSTDQRIYAATLGQGVFLSANGGSSWKGIDAGLTDHNATSLALSPTYSQDSTLWVTTATQGVFRSSNGGLSWTSIGIVPRGLSNLTSIHYQAIAIAGTAAAPTIMLAMFEGLWVWAPSDVMWNYVDTLPTRLIHHIYLAPNFAANPAVFPTTYGGGNLWSGDAGATWAFTNTGMQESYADAGAFSPNFAADGTLFSSSDAGLQRSVDFGATWQLTAQGLNTLPRGLAVSPNFAQDSTVFIGTDTTSGGSQSGLFVSTQAGDNWQPTNLTGIGVVSIAMSPAWATDQTAFAASAESGLYKSTDGGFTWSLITTLPKAGSIPAIVALSPNFPTDQTVLAASVIAGIYRSTDGGATWALLPNTISARFLDIAFSPNYANDQTFFAGTMQKGLVKFTAGGTKLSYVTSLPGAFVAAVAVSPNFANDLTMFAASYWGLYKSVDGGITWTYTVEPGRVEEFRYTFSTFVPQSPPSLFYVGSWSYPEPSLTTSTYSYALTGDTSAVAIFNFFGTGVRWISWTGPGQGSAAIELDGFPQGAVTLTAPSDEYQQNVWEQHGLACSPHQLAIAPLLGDGQTISLDALDTWVDSCPQVYGSDLHDPER